MQITDLAVGRVGRHAACHSHLKKKLLLQPLHLLRSEFRTGAKLLVVAQLAEWWLLTSEIRGLNPDIGKELFRTYLSVSC